MFRTSQKPKKQLCRKSALTAGSFRPAEALRREENKMPNEELIKESIPLLNPHGVLVCSTNYTQWSGQDFLSMLNGMFKSLRKHYTIVHKAHADKDFPILVNYPESNHLKFIAIQIR